MYKKKLDPIKSFIKYAPVFLVKKKSTKFYLSLNSNSKILNISQKTIFVIEDNKNLCTLVKFLNLMNVPGILWILINY